MTNEELFEDIKQLLVATVAQSETRLTAQVQAVESSVSTLSVKMENGFDGIGEAVADINDRLDKRDTEVEQRLIRLEHKAA